MQNLQYITPLFTKKKERFEIILEPLQAIIQLAILSFCPTGTRLAIQSNLLYIQLPTWSQGVVRTYYHDSKDDVFYLFHVVQRYNKFYSHLKTSSSRDEKRLFSLLIDLSKKGLDNLIQTYSHIDNPALLHTLQMYKRMLNNENQTSNNDDDESSQDVLIENSEGSKEEINQVFIKITKLYSDEALKVIYNTLRMMKDDRTNYEKYSQGLDLILEPINISIKKWISDNIVF